MLVIQIDYLSINNVKLMIIRQQQFLPGAVPTVPAMYDHGPSLTSMILSSHLTTSGVSAPLLQMPLPTLHDLPNYNYFLEFYSG